MFTEKYSSRTKPFITVPLSPYSTPKFKLENVPVIGNPKPKVTDLSLIAVLFITKPVFSNRKAIKSGQVTKENAHRYKQDVEKDYIYQQFINKEKKVKQNEKIQEVH
jgi:hypothetical protein